MKKLLLLFLLGTSLCSNAQIATGVNNLQAYPWRLFSNPNIVGLIHDGSQYRMYGFDKYALLDTTWATGKIATKNDMSAMVQKTSTITINGTMQDMSANRSWNVGDVSTSGSYSNPIWISSLSWSKITGAPSIPSQYNPMAGTGISITGTYPNHTITNVLPDQTVALTAGNRISISGTYPNFTISYVEPTSNIVSRSLNSNFTISATKQATVFYAINTSTTNPLLVGTSVGTAYLEYSINGGSTWINPSQVASSSGVGVTVTVALTTGNTSVLAGVIPANALVRIRTATSGTANVTYVVGQETY